MSCQLSSACGKKKKTSNKESELKHERRYRWHNPVFGSVNFACETRECSAGRGHGGKFSTYALFGCSRQRSWTCSWPCVVKKHTHNKREKRGGNIGGSRVYGLKVDAPTKGASRKNDHKPWLSLLSFQCMGPFVEKLLWPADKWIGLIETLEFPVSWQKTMYLLTVNGSVDH